MAAWRDNDPGDETTAYDDTTRIRRWNVERLVSVGLDIDAAILAAEADIDWHDVDRLVRRGCPVDRALEIVA